MNTKQILLLLVVALLPFLFYFFNGRFVDPDSYYYLNAVCNGGELRYYLGVFNDLVVFLPCNFLFIKAILFLLYFGILYVLSSIGELFDSRDGWIVGLIVAGLTLFTSEVWKFENDMFGYFFGFVALYFFIKYNLDNKWGSIKINKDLLFGVLFIVISGLLWNGVVYWLIPISFLTIYGVIPALVAPIIFSENYFNFLSANPLVRENQPLIGFAYFGIASVFLLGAFKSRKWIVVSYLLMLVPVLFQSKLFVLGIPFAVLICFEGMKLLWGDKNRGLFINSLIVFSLMMGLFWGNAALQQFPSEKDVKLIQHSVEMADSNVIQNDFSAGYIIKYYGGNPSCAGWICPYEMNGIVVNMRDTNTTCKIIEKSNNLQLL